MKANLTIRLILLFFGGQLLFFNCQSNIPHPGKLEVSGLIEAIETEVRSQVQGEIKEILVREGQRIKKGELLCLIDDQKLQLKLKQLLAALQGAEYKLRLFKKGTKQEIIAMAKNKLEIAKKELSLAKKNQERITRLSAQGAVTEVQKEEADLKLKAAQEQYQNAAENYQMVLRGREREEIEMVKAEINKLRAQLQLLQRQIEDTRIQAPSNGFLEVRQVEVGELAVPGSLLFTLVDLDRTYVKAYIPEKYIGKVIIGNAVEVSCDSYPDKTFKGTVDYIADEAEFAPKNIQTKEERLKLVFMIKSYLDNRQRLLKPGMPVDVLIRLENK